MASIASTTLSVPGRLESETQHPHKHQKYTRLRAMWLILTAVGGSTNGLRKYHGMFTHAIYSNIHAADARWKAPKNCSRMLNFHAFPVLQHRTEADSTPEIGPLHPPTVATVPLQD
ncbi:hypothetical protein MRS44_004500 [Fusarium solani]|uniref:uncharacterized protein n=1 Tax=Fusarium solani TaxID=169388 RepID=UPI0032C3F27B|nr:hypothetical protein MRS44_004500 [Fusarium solani]